jgi:hypothetical protein
MLDRDDKPAGFRVTEDGRVEVMTSEEVNKCFASLWREALRQLRPKRNDD